jgi:hypothetical protein
LPELSNERIPRFPRRRSRGLSQTSGSPAEPSANRLTLAFIAEQDRRFEHGAIDQAIAELFVARLIATISRT